MAYLTSALTGILVLAASSGWAESLEEMPNQYMDSVAAKLIMAGFHDVRMVDLKANKLVANDEWGNEVLIVVHPSNRQIMSETTVRILDQ